MQDQEQEEEEGARSCNMFAELSILLLSMLSCRHSAACIDMATVLLFAGRCCLDSS